MAGETPFSTKKLSFLTASFGTQLGVAKLKTCVRIEKIDLAHCFQPQPVEQLYLPGRFSSRSRNVSNSETGNTCRIADQEDGKRIYQEIKPEETEETTLPSRNKHCKDTKRHQNRFQHWHSNCR